MGLAVFGGENEIETKTDPLLKLIGLSVFGSEEGSVDLV